MTDKKQTVIEREWQKVDPSDGESRESRLFFQHGLRRGIELALFNCYAEGDAETSPDMFNETAMEIRDRLEKLLTE